MYQIYWCFAVVYTFIKWGLLWGLVSVFVPVFPMIDLVRYLLA